MMKKILFLNTVVIVSIVQLAFGGVGSEDISSDTISGASSFNSFASIKSKISALMQENRNLEAEYKMLTQQISALNSSIKISQQSSANQENFINPTNLNLQRNNSTQDFSNLQNQIMIKESKVAFLKQKSLDLNEQINTLEQQLIVYQLKNKELESQGSLTQMKIEDSIKTQSQELDALKARQKALDEQYASVSQQLQKAQEDSMQFSMKNNALQQENREIEKTLIQFKAETKLKEKEADILRNKKLLVTRATAVDLDDSKNQRASLISEVNALEEEYKSLDTNVNQSLSLETNKKELIANIIRLDKENQDLRQKIAQLQDKVEAAK